MPEELSPESKLYVKEEIEKVRKEINKDVEEIKSKATKIFSAIALVVGLITGLGIYGSAKLYIKNTIEDKLGIETVAAIQNNKDKAEDLYNKIVDYETDAKDIITSLSSKMIIGTIVPYGGNIETGSKEGELIEVREGWFLCNGANLDREKYKYLFDVIGEAFGGAPASGTFNLPDLRGRVAVGAGIGTDKDKKLTPRTLGENGGEEEHTLNVNEMPLHNHKFKEEGVQYAANTWKGGGSAGDSWVVKSKPYNRQTDNSGGDKGRVKAFNNLQPYLVVNYIIKVR